MKKTKSEQTEVATTESAELQALTAEPPTKVPADAAVEELAQTAYAKVAEELKFKGDFPAWDQVSDRGRTLYLEGAAHVQSGGSPRTRFEEVVSKMLFYPKTKG
jgi:hypothetical protein